MRTRMSTRMGDGDGDGEWKKGNIVRNARLALLLSYCFVPPLLSRVLWTWLCTKLDASFFFSLYKGSGEGDEVRINGF
jgi:hypothetical protein